MVAAVERWFQELRECPNDVPTGSPNSAPSALDVVRRHLLRDGHLVHRVSVRSADSDWARQLLRVRRLPDRGPLVSNRQPQEKLDLSFSREEGWIFGEGDDELLLQPTKCGGTRRAQDAAPWVLLSHREDNPLYRGPRSHFVGRATAFLKEIFQS